MRLALLMLMVAGVVGCGSQNSSAQAHANAALLDRAPVYPGATGAKTTPGDTFAARDWTLPPRARAEQVIDWYVATLQARGWKVTGKSFNTIRATFGQSSLSVGVRARTLEVVAAG